MSKINSSFSTVSDGVGSGAPAMGGVGISISRDIEKPIGGPSMRTIPGG